MYIPSFPPSASAHLQIQAHTHILYSGKSLEGSNFRIIQKLPQCPKIWPSKIYHSTGEYLITSEHAWRSVVLVSSREFLHTIYVSWHCYATFQALPNPIRTHKCGSHERSALALQCPSQVQYTRSTSLQYVLLFSRHAQVNLRRVKFLDRRQIFENLTYEHLAQYKGVDLSEFLALWIFSATR